MFVWTTALNYKGIQCTKYTYIGTDEINGDEHNAQIYEPVFPSMHMTLPIPGTAWSEKSWEAVTGDSSDSIAQDSNGIACLPA